MDGKNSMTFSLEGKDDFYIKYKNYLHDDFYFFNVVEAILHWFEKKIV